MIVLYKTTKCKKKIERIVESIHRLERETQRTGRKYTQREFVLGLIEEALNGVEAKSAHFVSACGENCVLSLASPSPAGPAGLRREP